MANALTTAAGLSLNPWRLDTPTTFSLCTGLHLRIKHIRWVGATTAGHQCILNDDSSNIVWDAVASGANFEESDLHYNEVRIDRPIGLFASALQSGRVYVTYG